LTATQPAISDCWPRVHALRPYGALRCRKTAQTRDERPSWRTKTQLASACRPGMTSGTGQTVKGNRVGIVGHAAGTRSCDRSICEHHLQRKDWGLSRLSWRITNKNRHDSDLDLVAKSCRTASERALAKGATQRRNRARCLMGRCTHCWQRRADGTVPSHVCDLSRFPSAP